jgi:hypothetical protein
LFMILFPERFSVSSLPVNFNADQVHDYWPIITDSCHPFRESLGFQFTMELISIHKSPSDQIWKIQPTSYLCFGNWFRVTTVICGCSASLRRAKDPREKTDGH